MTVYYNEFDQFAAQWLRNLSEKGLIPNGVIDERSITDVQEVQFLVGYSSCDQAGDDMLDTTPTP